jgi:ankyrin repeat protein
MISESFVAAVENDDLETVRHLVSSLPRESVLASRLETGDLVIHRAAGAPRVLNFLVELGADVNAVTPNSHGLRDPEDSSSDDDDGSDLDDGLEKKKKVAEAKLTTLHLSAASGHVECVRVLAKVNGVNVNARDGEGSTPLHLASTSGHLECVIW